MKKSLMIVFIFTSFTALAQRNDFQIRLGAGYGIYDVNTVWAAKIQSKEYKTETADSFTEIAPQVELKYYIAKAHLAIGLHFSSGLREVVSTKETAYNLARFGLGIEYNIIDRSAFKWFAGVQPTFRALGIYNGLYIGEKPAYDLTTVWSGVNFSANTGVMYYVKDSWFGLYANAGWEGGKMPLSYILFDNTEQNKDNIEATVKTSGINFNLGLICRLRSKKSAGKVDGAE